MGKAVPTDAAPVTVTGALKIRRGPNPPASTAYWPPSPSPSQASTRTKHGNQRLATARHAPAQTPHGEIAVDVSTRW